MGGGVGGRGNVDCVVVYRGRNFASCTINPSEFLGVNTNTSKSKSLMHDLVSYKSKPSSQPSLKCPVAKKRHEILYTSSPRGHCSPKISLLFGFLHDGQKPLIPQLSQEFLTILVTHLVNLIEFAKF